MTGSTPDDTLLRCIRAVPDLELINAEQWGWTHQRSEGEIVALVDRVRTEQAEIAALRHPTEAEGD